MEAVNQFIVIIVDDNLSLVDLDVLNEAFKQAWLGFMLSFVELLEHVGQLYPFMFHHFSFSHENFISNKTAVCEVAPSDID